MKLKALTFTASNDEDGAIPERVTVEMTIQEALWMAKTTGRCRGESPHNSIYDCLVGDVFNRFWDDGTDDAQRLFRVETPPIKYDE